MLTDAISTLGVIKLFFQLVKDDEKKYDPTAFFESLPESGVGEITIHGRGGLEVPAHEIKQSPQFAAMQNYAVERIKHDTAEEVLISIEPTPSEKHQSTEGEHA